jgi:hypothetical protein
MNAFLVIIFIIAVIVLLIGGFAASLHFLLWIGIVVAVLAAIVWVVRQLTGRRS